MHVLFLDCDGVLNGHQSQRTKQAGGFEHVLCDRLNRVLTRLPTLKLVISSAWRYQILSGNMKLQGFEVMLVSHGIEAWHKVIGNTVADGPIEAAPHYSDDKSWQALGLRYRRDQILAWVNEHKPAAWLAVDDLNLDLGEYQVITDGNCGLTANDVDEICKRLIKQGVPNGAAIRLSQSR